MNSEILISKIDIVYFCVGKIVGGFLTLDIWISVSAWESPSMWSHITSKPSFNNVQMESFISNNFIFRSESDAINSSGRVSSNCSGNGSFGIGNKSSTICIECTVFYPAVNKCQCKEFLVIRASGICENIDSFIDEFLDISKRCSIIENTETLSLSEDFTTVITTIEPSTTSCWGSERFSYKFYG